MNDEELLALAAKAHGDLVCEEGLGWIHEKNGVRGAWWDPLTNDSDALRLAVALRLVVHIWDDGELVSAAKTLPNGDDPPSEDCSSWSSADAHASGDLASATRRAIVRAAAEIGAAAQKGQA